MLLSHFGELKLTLCKSLLRKKCKICCCCLSEIVLATMFGNSDEENYHHLSIDKQYACMKPKKLDSELPIITLGIELLFIF